MAGQRGTTFLYGQLVLVLLLTVGGLWVATEWVAGLLAFQPQLGRAWFTVHGWPIFHPWQYLTWQYHYGAYAPAQFAQAAWAAYGGVAVAILSAVAMSLYRARGDGRSNTYGSARWADAKDLRDAGLLGPAGVVLGLGPDGHYLRHDGAEHVAMIAPTRSGKGVGVVIPTLLTWPASVIVTDMKQENWNLTAGYRRRFSHVIHFNPGERGTAHYNPLLEIRQGEREVKDTQAVADMLVDPDGVGERNHWTDSAHSLLTGAILHVLYTARNKSLPGVLALLSDPRRSIFDTFTAMLTTVHHPHGAQRYGWKDPLTGLPTNTHPVIAGVARQMLNKSDNELAGVVSTALRNLALYQDPVLAAAVSDSDFRIEDLMGGARPVSLYLVIPPGDLQRLRPLLRLMLDQIVRRFTERLQEPGPAAGEHPTLADWTRRVWHRLAGGGGGQRASASSYQHRLLLLLDEFPALGRLASLESALAFVSGYGIKALLIAQSRNQLTQAYGPNHTILDNCHVRQIFTPNDAETAKLISDMTGQTTVVHQQRNYAGNRLALWLGHVMVMDQEAARPLMTAGEVLELPDSDALLFVAGRPPIRTRKLRYYQDTNFQSRLLAAPPIPSGVRYPYRPSDPDNPWDALGAACASATAAVGAGGEGGMDLQNTDRLLEQGSAPPPTPVPDGADPEAAVRAQMLDLVAATLQAAESEDPAGRGARLTQIAVLTDEEQLLDEAKAQRHQLQHERALKQDHHHDPDLGMPL
ncbi:MAG: hypothetical protein B7Z66_14900 [Chromatiales bacterium 21-64-14]|nr:MAG: hypothetical protein B7Z66_14900 [Chromatiales bacterium 21-64-14]HQU17110.1 IncP-type conjugal transfer protein TraG [Gammaproteobacteria bacterium]